MGQEWESNADTVLSNMHDCLGRVWEQTHRYACASPTCTSHGIVTLLVPRAG